MALVKAGPYSTMRAPIGEMQTYFQAVLGQKWETNLETALTKAAQRGDIVLAAFVGLTWCAPCQMLEAEVYKQFEFLKWSLGKVVLLQIDYVKQFDQNPAEKQQLFTKYGVKGFPSILGISASGAELGRVVGYASGTGVASWVAKFETATGL